MTDFAVVKPKKPAGRVPEVNLTHKPGFVISEFLGDQDSRLWHGCLTKLGFVDRTPLRGGKVFTFRDVTKTDEFVKYRDAFVADRAALDAEWQCLSGHHGALLQPPRRETDQELLDRLNDHDETGFFNKPYYDGRWHRQRPQKGEVFMFSAKAAANVASLTPLDNPFLRPSPLTKGVICIACNTLTYRRTRMFLRHTFPNAVIFGMMNTTPGGSETITSFTNLPGDFWKDPKQALTKGGSVDVAAVEKMIVEMNNEYVAQTTGNQKADIGVMVEDDVFWMDYGFIQKNIDKRLFRQEAYDFRWAP